MLERALATLLARVPLWNMVNEHKLILGLNVFKELLELRKCHPREVRYLVDVQPYIDSPVSVFSDALSVNNDVRSMPLIIRNSGSVMLEPVLGKERDYHLNAFRELPSYEKQGLVR